jgi:hypothetical protein
LKAKYNLSIILQDHKMEAIPERGPRSAAEKGSLDWSFEPDVENTPDEGRNAKVECKISTPVDRDVQLKPLGSSESISAKFMSASGPGYKDILSVDSFLLWLERSVTVHENLLSRLVAVSGTFGCSWLDNMSDLLEMGGDAGDWVQEIMRKNASKVVVEHLKNVREGIKVSAEPWQNEYVGKSVFGA